MMSSEPMLLYNLLKSWDCSRNTCDECPLADSVTFWDQTIMDEITMSICNVLKHIGEEINGKEREEK